MNQNCTINGVQMAMWYVSILQAIWTAEVSADHRFYLFLYQHVQQRGGQENQ